jgi:hypothetical protein
LPARPDLPEKGEPLGVELAGWLYAMHQLAQRGEHAAADALIETYRERPQYLDRLSAAAHVAERAWLDVLTPRGEGQAALTRQVAEREIERLKADLAAGSTDPLEGLLIARIAAAWLGVQYADMHLADGLAAGGQSWAQIEYRARHVERMGRNFLRATEVLARVRRLRAGAMQINIADRQINVAS